MKSIIVVGSSNTDLVVKVDRLPSEGETVMGENLQKFSGGKGANQAVAAARAGAQVSFSGAVGMDGFGLNAIHGFEKESLDLQHLKRVEGVPSGTALIAVNRGGHNQIIVAPGANNHVLFEDIENIDFSSFGFAMFQLEIPHESVWMGLRKAKEAECQTILNPAPASEIPKNVFQDVDYLIPNQHELEIIAGHGTLEEQAAAVLELGVNNLVVTLGKKGVCCINTNGTIIIPAPDFPVVDTVGAGDCFCGVFTASLCRGLELEEALRHAVVAASLSVGIPGAQASYVNWKEICAVLKRI